MTETAHRLATGVSWIDLNFLGRPRRIAAGLVHDASGTVLVDPGPASCMGRLEQALAAGGSSFDAVTHILLTHIHLDHAGSVGTLVRRRPWIRVVVHRRGAPHLVDPSRLLASAERLYGGEMDRLWGPCDPVASSHLDIVDGEERLAIAGREWEVAYTPGHASHHVSYLDRSNGIAWVGDTAGICVDGGYILPPTPPPDIDLELWERSLERIDRWHAQTLFLTHCGPASAPRVHLQAMWENLSLAAGWARELVEAPLSDDQQRAQFEERLRREMRRRMNEDMAAAYESAAGFGLMWPGLARYWRKRLPALT